MQKGFTQIHLLAAGLIALLLAGGIYLYSQNKLPFVSKPSQKACTQEAKLCPDGSYVGREGSNCEFKKCPETTKKDEGQICAQVMTPARDPKTGECKEFPTPCDVPKDWEKVDSCPISARCAKQIDVDSGSTSYDSNNIGCMETVLSNCQSYSGVLLYGLGSMRLTINGKQDDQCLFDLVHEIEMDERQFKCTIPVDKMSGWTSWKKGDGLEAVKDILAFCNRI